MTNGRPDRVVALVARHHGGPFSNREARAAGMSYGQIARRLQHGEWRELLPRTYVHASTVVTPDILRRAALLWAGDGAVLSHRSAGELWGLDGVGVAKPELTVAGTRHPRSELVAVHRSLALEPEDVVHRDGMRVTSPTRTVVDLASVLDPTALRVAFESARRERRTSVAAVRDRHASIGGPGRPGAAALGALLEQLDGAAPCEYPLEVLVAEILERSSLPAPERQFRVRAGGHRFRLDFAWPDQRVALECDGRRRHSEDGDFARDRARWSCLAIDRWRLLFATWSDATQRADALVRRLDLALAA
jgi:Transcriptional regulator, AbiEi antitoxin